MEKPVNQYEHDWKELKAWLKRNEEVLLEASNRVTGGQKTHLRGSWEAIRLVVHEMEMTEGTMDLPFDEEGDE